MAELIAMHLVVIINQDAATMQKEIICKKKVNGGLPVTQLVVIPSDKLHKVIIQGNSCLGIKYT